jgi:hypothetical protein
VLSFHKRGNDEGDDEGEGKRKWQKARTEVWAGDGFSRVWVLDLTTGTPTVPPISTAITKGDPSRADELATIPTMASFWSQILTAVQTSSRSYQPIAIQFWGGSL